MKHYIDAPAGSETFRQQFFAIREAFLATFRYHVAGQSVQKLKVVGLSTGTVDWVKTIDDAGRFMGSMIDDGFSVAFRGTKGLFGLKLHIYYWEDPDTGPKWPWGRPLFEEVHDGVIRGKPNEHGA
jgi:hypothetical protein